MPPYVGLALALGFGLALGLLLAILFFPSIGPLPVTIVAPPPKDTVLCTMEFGPTSAGAPFIHLGYAINVNQVDWDCPAGVTKIDVSRIVYAPDLGHPASGSQNVAQYRVTVAHTPDKTSPSFRASRVLAVLTEGAPDAAVVRPFRLDISGAGSSDLAGAGSIHLQLKAFSGSVAHPPSLAGGILFIGTPVQ